jgi:anti-sigma regulatory factor (Ser/Thr protein kinase)
MAAGVDRRKLELYLPASEETIRRARGFVDRLEALDGYGDVRFAARLLVSELFTNAVKYGSRRADARIRLLVAIDDTHVRAEIGDTGRGFAEGRQACPTSTRNRGAGSHSSTRLPTGGESSTTARRASGSSWTSRRVRRNVARRRGASSAARRLSRYFAEPS